jgi:hypothetical protein
MRRGSFRQGGWVGIKQVFETAVKRGSIILLRLLVGPKTFINLLVQKYLFVYKPVSSIGWWL